MIDGMPNRPLYFYQKDIIEYNGVFVWPFSGEHSIEQLMLYFLSAVCWLVWHCFEGLLSEPSES